jgi:hypothetical protein
MCRCGAEITPNTYKSHLHGPKCLLDKTSKDDVLIVLDMRSAHERAWLISEGEDAVANNQWFLSVINMETKLSDWTFDSPRPKGVMRASSSKKMGNNRRGSKNPYVIKKVPDFDKKIIEKRGKDLYKEITGGDEKGIGYIFSLLNKEFPDFMYMYADEIGMKSKRGESDKNTVLAKIVGISIDEWISVSAKQRGKIIRKGQLSSDKFKKIASKIGSEAISRWRVTKPQIRLFDIIKKFDEKAVLEFRVNIDGRHRSFDIYSPKINTLIEMHGRVWHDLSKTKKGLIEICKNNIKNDDIKKSMALSLNKGYVVLWDDEEDSWEKQVRGIYENKES